MQLRPIIVLLILVCFASADEPKFLPFATILRDPAWSLSYCPLVSRSVTLEHGMLLRSGAAEDDVRRIYIVFYERRASLTKLLAGTRSALIEGVLPGADLAKQPLSGWHTVGLVEATHAERKEPLHWLVFVMLSGSVDFAPALQLYEPQTEGNRGSRLFQQFEPKNAEKLGLSIECEKFGRELRRLSGDDAQPQQR